MLIIKKLSMRTHRSSCHLPFVSKTLRMPAPFAQGQATVEAAFLVPLLFIGLLLLIQPGILLYDRMIMHAAASEACRLLATKTDVAGASQKSCESFVRHRLGAIPSVAFFHVHEGQCTWTIDLEGDEASPYVRTRITHEVRPLPLLDLASTLLGIVNERGNFEVQVQCNQPTQPAWILSATDGKSPDEWIGAWRV